MEAKDTAMLLRKVGLKTKGLDATAADKSLEQERQTFTRQGEKQHGFASSIVPTVEEKMLAETYLSDGQYANGHAESMENGHASHREPQARVDGELFGAPANTQAARDDRLPGTHHEEHATEMEEKAIDARSIARKHLSSKVTGKQWTVPTPTPHVDPYGFEDPICDAFWEKTWLACAVHNVRDHRCLARLCRELNTVQTEIYRKVFHAIPDDRVTTWKQYKEFVVHHERLNKPVCPILTFCDSSTQKADRTDERAADAGTCRTHALGIWRQ